MVAASIATPKAGSRLTTRPGAATGPTSIRPSRVALCLTCHAKAEAWLETRGLAKRRVDLSVFETVALRLHRVGVACEQLAAGPIPAPLYAALGEVFARWADLLLQGVAALDELCPQWRDEPAFYARERITR